MTNTYLLPVQDPDGIYIQGVVAKNFDEAEDKFMRELSDIYDIDEISSWEDFLVSLHNIDVYVGDIYDKEEF